MLQLIDHTYSSPAENLACDEFLLDQLEKGEGSPSLRLWESSTYFVVVGYANKVATEVNVEACARRNIGIYRRCSGGGTVVQGPGCLSYSLVLPITPETASITETNCYIMRKQRDALGGGNIKIQGCTDLTLGPLKFSGNAQRRKSRALIFHGSFLYNVDLSLIDEVLLHPSKEPEYRARRSHQEFLTNLQLSSEEIRERLAKAWQVNEKKEAPARASLQELLLSKYENRSWNEKF